MRYPNALSSALTAATFEIDVLLRSGFQERDQVIAALQLPLKAYEAGLRFSIETNYGLICVQRPITDNILTCDAKGLTELHGAEARLRFLEAS